MSRAALVAILLLLAGGCSPLVPLLSAALGGGSGKTSPRAGPFGGAPSSTQNSRPADSPISDTLSQIDPQVKASCQALLPPPEPMPTTGCMMRPTCLPGSEQPIRLRLCAAQVTSAAD